MRRLVVGLAIISLAALAFSWAQADDQEIAKEITEKLKQEQKVGHLRDFDINLKVADGNVVLKGHVTSPEQQKLALETARSAKGVKHVVSDLQIASPTPTADAAQTAAAPAGSDSAAEGSPTSDSQIGEQLSAELKRRKDAGELKGFGLGISVNKGIVVLRGRVSSAEQLQLARHAAKQIAGVRDVVSHVVVVAEVAAQEAPAAPEPNADEGAHDEEISQLIAAAVKAQKAAGKLKGFDIDLAVEKGIVTYSGQVPTAEQMELAMDLARQTPGVQNVVNKLIVVPPVSSPKEAPQEAKALAARSDAEISQSLAESLKAQKAAGKFKGFDLNLAVQNGIVKYTGRVASEAQLQLALDLARQTAGVRDVVNQLTVAEPPAKSVPAETMVAQTAAVAPVPISDADIAHRIVSNLQEKQTAGSLKGFQIDTSVVDGVVTYSGHVGNQEQLQTALEIARQSAGVRDVVNQLTIVQPVSNDTKIAQQIAASLKQQRASGSLKGFNIDVAVQEGIVTYTGHVANASQLQTALAIANQMDGVREVVNQMVVSEPAPAVVPQPASESVAATRPQTAAGQSDVTPVSYRRERAEAPAVDPVAEDRRIGEDISQALDGAKRSGMLRGFGIGVRVERSRVWLQGRVSSAEQRMLATEIARSVHGVEQVTNNLSVTVPQPEPTVAPPRSPNYVVRASAPGGPPVAQASNPYAYAQFAQVAGGNEQTAIPAPRPLGAVQSAAYVGAGIVAAPFVAISQAVDGSPMPAQLPSPGAAQVPARYDHPYLPGYAWPSYAAYPNYAAVTYPKQYSPTAWPYIGPFYPYPQVPLGWRKVTLKWDDGWWQLNFKSK